MSDSASKPSSPEPTPSTFMVPVGLAHAAGSAEPPAADGLHDDVEARLQASLRELSRGAAVHGGAEALRGRGSSVRPMSGSRWLMDTLSVLLNAPPGTDALQALVLHLASSLHCDRVALGLRRHSREDLEVLAVSDLPRMDDAPDLVRDLHAAMKEAEASACTLTHPTRRQDPMNAGLAHVQLSRAMGACAVCTVPLGSDGAVEGALTLQRDLSAPFRSDEVLRLEQVAAFLAPLLRLYLNQPQARGHTLLMDLPPWLEPLRGRLRWVAAAVVAVTALRPVQHEVVAPTQVHGLHERQLVAPRDGFISVVYARPGAQVKNGQSLVDFDGERASNELRAAEAGLSQAESAMSEALARHDQAQIVVQMAKVDEARARTDLARRDLERGRVLSPLDGVVVSGDLSRSVGAPVKRGDVLMTVAPTNGYRLVMWVDERDVAQLRVGTLGALRVVASPGKAMPVTVTRVTPVSKVREGRNGFEVEAALVAGSSVEMRPGYEGVARLYLGRHPLIVDVGSRFFDWLRISWWTLMG